MHLAHVNVARPLGPMDGAVMAEFARAIDPITPGGDGAAHLFAERSPGFVWPLQGDEGHEPSPGEARQRIEHLQVHGPSPEAFPFTHVFDPTGA